MRIGIDLDDTLVNTKELQKFFWKLYLENYPSDGYDPTQLPENINHFGDPVIDKFWNVCREYLAFPDFFPYVSEITNKLHDEGYELIIVTSRPKDKYPDMEIKLRSHFEEYGVVIDKIITDARNKGEVCVNNNIDVLIDDDIRHIESALEYGIKAIHFNDINWLDVYNKIIEIRQIKKLLK